MGIADTAGLSGGSAGQSWMCNAGGGPRSQLGLGFQVGSEPGTSGFRLIRDPPQDYVALGGFYAGSTAARSFTAYTNTGRSTAAAGNENSGFELMRRPPPRWNNMAGQEELFAQNEEHHNNNRSLMLSVRQRRRRGGVASNPCQDCGNQAKKDCGYQRCRTCCKSRGFQCSTHMRSTWIPAAQRRERQQVGGGGASSSSAPRSKRARILALAAAQSHNNTTSNSTGGTSPPPSPLRNNTSTLLLTYGQQEVNSVGSSFPSEVRAAAVFKCLKISASDDAKGEYAYKATVKIGDHIFKGVLYDQGGYSSPTENQRKRSNNGEESGSFWNDDLNNDSNNNNNRIAMTQGGGVDQVVARERMVSGLGSLMEHHVISTTAVATTATAAAGADPQRWFACGE